ncbi:MAG: glycosyltransferase [Oligoflexia bacterium]|nr:glycosyltransferase [Oligoflexia bacterium]
MFTLVLPFYNEINKLKITLEKIFPNLNIYNINQVILAHNGKKLDTKIIKNELDIYLQDKRFLLLHTDDPGLGSGYRLGIRHAISKYIILSACDFPFGFSDIEAFLDFYNKNQTFLSNKWDIHPSGHPIYGQNLPDECFVIGSKAHPRSVIFNLPPTRKLLSLGFYWLRVITLGKQTPKDSQGTIIISKKLAIKLEKLVISNNYFFSLEIITIHLWNGGIITEIPVRYNVNRTDKSSINFFREILIMLVSLIKLRSYKKYIFQ